MQRLTFERPGGAPLGMRAHVGAVASGNLEVLYEPTQEAVARVIVTTSVDGYEAIWRATIDRFLRRHTFSGDIEINDFGATPATVTLRLEQAVELAR